MTHPHHALAIEAIVNGPQTAAPPSFNGDGVLFVLNLFAMTTAAQWGALALLGIVGGFWRYRRSGWDHPATLLRMIAALALCCFTLRSAGEALYLWAWNPADPITTAWVVSAKRIIDPIGIACAYAAMAVGALSWKALMRQLAREPLPQDIWERLPVFHRPLKIGALSLVASVAIVVLR